MRVVGVVADPDEAQKWYQRARELGAVDGQSRLTGCKCWELASCNAARSSQGSSVKGSKRCVVSFPP
jgi:TPR repeat protein